MFSIFSVFSVFFFNFFKFFFHFFFSFGPTNANFCWNFQRKLKLKFWILQQVFYCSNLYLKKLQTALLSIFFSTLFKILRLFIPKSFYLCFSQIFQINCCKIFNFHQKFQPDHFRLFFQTLMKTMGNSYSCGCIWNVAIWGVP